MRKRFFGGLITVFLAVWFLTALTFGGQGVIRLNYVKAGATFRLYKIGSISSSGGLVVSEAFSGYSVDYEGSDTAETLAAYIERDNIEAAASAVTGSDGSVSFSDLERGYYLILGEVYTDSDYIYTALPVLLPVYDETEYEVTGKYETASVLEETLSVSALKVWSGSSESSITVQLLCDGEVYDEQILNSYCSWRYTWTDLDASYSWQVAEKEIPSGYSVNIEKDGTVFILLNTEDGDTPGGDTPTVTTTETTTEAPTETTTERPVETTTKAPPSGGGGSVVVNTTEATTEAPAETTTEGKSEKETEGEEVTEEEIEETTNKRNSGEPGEEPEDGDEGGDNRRSDGGSEIVTDEFGNVISGGELGNSSASSFGSEGDNSSVGINSEGENAQGSAENGASEGAAALPQTGQLWYPVPILSCLGMLCLILGIGRRRMS
ncbi:MAG: Cna B-type domain-containing protein [Clostridiales bacterium]|nr:Cna B-type domain-containing protein [Clostridiales bacterium]